MRDDLPNFIRRVSLKCLNEQTRINVDACAPPSDTDPEHKWQSFIVIGAEGITVDFRCFYSDEHLWPKVAAILGLAPDQCNQELVGSVMMEYCNHVGGFIKQGLESNGLVPSMGLPIYTVSSVDFEFRKAEEKVFDDRWEVRWPDGAIVCHVRVTTSHSDTLKNILVEERDLTDSGELMFL